MKQSVKKIFNSFGYKLEKSNLTPHPQHQRPLTAKHFFDLYFSMIELEKFFLVQIGANDGKSRDTLFEYISKYNLAGVLIEPQVDVFARLKEAHHENKRIRFLNAAIFSESGKKDFYSVKPTLINEANYFETTAIASFDKDTFFKTLERRIGTLIQKTSENINDYYDVSSIDALSFPDFLLQENISKIDLLYLDCEGVDYEIIKMLNFKTLKPKTINFESKFLSDTDRVDCEFLLESHGYQLFRYENDTCAFLI